MGELRRGMQKTVGADMKYDSLSLGKKRKLRRQIRQRLALEQASKPKLWEATRERFNEIKKTQKQKHLIR